MSHLALVYNNTEIREVDGRPYLTDMHKAAGAPPNLRPSEWLRQERTRRLARQIAVELGHSANVGQDHISFLAETRRGVGGGTVAEFKLALAYAADLSPAFHSWMLDVASERLREVKQEPSRSFDEERFVSVVAKIVHQVLDQRAANDGVFDSSRARRIAGELVSLGKRQARLDGDEKKWRGPWRSFVTEVRDVAELPSTGAWAVMPLAKFARTQAAVAAIGKRIALAEQVAESRRQLVLIASGDDGGKAA